MVLRLCCYPRHDCFQSYAIDRLNPPGEPTSERPSGPTGE
jgi:hypothetical protein